MDQPLPEYPRPQLTRPDWANLNGIWDFAVTSANAGQPASFPEQIRVPFAAESALSGIHRKITQNDRLWYKRTFTVPAGWNGRRVQLNFGASDWRTTVWVNGQQAGAVHSGGFDAFRFDITPLLNGGR
ncbi:sugar-binding domain-containing protein [Streptomyces sp. JL2001]|uniref:sugar-binding domain-containing protein n=1 Tax=Streptomyces sp. JL2001 TaxID=3342488 RepID=UPI003D808C45